MSLSARISLLPSRPLAAAERAIPLAGLTIATTTLMARWPSATAGLLAAAVLLAGLFAYAERCRARRLRPITLGVADRAQVDVRFGSDGATEDTWRLVESTVAWPGFAMLALSLDGRPATILRRPILTRELSSDQRRALARFLIWTLRSRGGGSGPGESHGR